MQLTVNEIKAVRTKLNRIDKNLKFTSEDIRKAALHLNDFDSDSIASRVIENLSSIDTIDLVNDEKSLVTKVLDNSPSSESTGIQNTNTQEAMQNTSSIEVRNPANSAIVSMAIEYSEVELSDTELVEVHNTFSTKTDVKLKEIIKHIEDLVSRKLDEENRETYEALSNLRNNVQNLTNRNLTTFNDSMVNILKGSTKQRMEGYQQWARVLENGSKQITES
jgi:hypothetical protein